MANVCSYCGVRGKSPRFFKRETFCSADHEQRWKEAQDRALSSYYDDDLSPEEQQVVIAKAELAQVEEQVNHAAPTAPRGGHKQAGRGVTTTTSLRHT